METFNAACYRQIVELFIVSLGLQERFCRFQQEGATAHTAMETIAFLHEFIGDRLTSHPNWLPRGPDLTPPDVSSRGYVNDKIFCNPSNTMDEIKLRITEAINATEPQTLTRVVPKFLPPIFFKIEK